MERLIRQILGALVCLALLHSWFGHDLLHDHSHSELEGSSYTLLTRNRDVPRALNSEAPILPTMVEFAARLALFRVTHVPCDARPAPTSRVGPKNLLPRPPPVEPSQV